MANKRASYVTTRNINKVQSLMNMGMSTTQISNLMSIPFNHATYLRTLVNNKSKSSTSKDVNVKPVVNYNKPMVNKKPRVSNAVVLTKENVNVIRTGNNITVTINLAI
jgi:hypothetical protein